MPRCALWLDDFYQCEDEDSDDEDERRRVRQRIIARAMFFSGDEGVTLDAQQTMHTDGRSSGKARQPRFGDLASEQKHLQWRHSSLNKQWKLLLHEMADDTRVKGTWSSIEFRKCFGISRPVFDILYVETGKDKKFKDSQWHDGTRGIPSQPLIQKVAGAMSMLTNDLTAKIAGQLSGVGKSTMQAFFPKWMLWLRETQSLKHIYLPEGAHLRKTMMCYAKLGFPGAMCSTDGVHVLWAKCPSAWKWIHIGEKKSPSRVYNISVGPNTEIFYVPDASFPGAHSLL
ncbi:hypothetical protein AB1Y20_005901 [Prymnesium parvum]|uniref:DDE Tnp4 domain-containing protein n=1 Tax=Prymnesium parvum TaxID=97485 RepID=A0AB34J058_PRYPA